MAVEEVEGKEDESKTSQEKTKLSHKKWRRLLQKEKRRLKRQQEAERRKKLKEQEKWRYENDAVYRAKLEAKERAAERKRKQEEEESKRQEQLWLEGEALAQVAFKKMKEREERKEKERIEQELRIKQEWEAEERSKKEKEEKKKQEIQEKEVIQKLDWLLIDYRNNAVFQELEKTPTPHQDSSKEAPWHNPMAPSSNNQNYGTEQDTVNCSFYLKTGACRFGDRCSRVHPRLQSSVTLMIPYMYQDIRLSQTMLDEADHDTGLEFDEEESYEQYKAFFDDVLPEFKKAGKVVQFKVCCNHEPHLRGNVYVQYSNEEECAQAFASFNGRWYAGRQLSCEYSPVTKWRSAICGLFTRKQCPRGKNCNFLHVYHNPGNAFRNMDRDDLSPGRTPYSERGSERRLVDWRRESREGSVRHGESSERRRERYIDYGGRGRDRDWQRERDRRDKRDRFGRDVERERIRDKDRDGDRNGEHDKYLDRERDFKREKERERERKRDRGRDYRYDREDEFDINKDDTNREKKPRSRLRSSSKERRRKRKRHSENENDDETQNSNQDRLNVLRSRDHWSTSSGSEEDNKKTNKRSGKSAKESESGRNSVDSDENSSVSSSSRHRKRKHRSSHKHHKKSKKKHKKHKHRTRRTSDESDTEKQYDSEEILYKTSPKDDMATKSVNNRESNDKEKD